MDENKQSVEVGLIRKYFGAENMMKNGFEIANYMQNTLFKMPSRFCCFSNIFEVLVFGYQAEKQLLPFVI